MGLGLTVGDGVLCEDEEVKKGDKVSHDEAWPWVLEIVAKAGIYFHPAEPPGHATPGIQREREREWDSKYIFQSDYWNQQGRLESKHSSDWD